LVIAILCLATTIALLELLFTYVKTSRSAQLIPKPNHPQMQAVVTLVCLLSHPVIFGNFVTAARAVVLKLFEIAYHLVFF